MPISYRAAQSLIKRGDEEALTLALAQKLNPNLTNENGWSLLMLAAVEGSIPLARILLTHGADPNLANNKKATATTIAANRGYTAFVDLLNEPRN